MKRFNQRASKSLKKLNRLSKLPNKEVKKAVQIETALKKCNPEILNKINKKKSVEKFDKQIDNLFKTNKAIADLEETVEDIENSELGLLSRMPSPSLGQKSSKLFEKNAMSMETNQEKGWKTVVHDTEHTGKKHGKESKVDLQSVGGCQLPFGGNFSQIAGRNQAREILVRKKIEIFLMAIDGITNQVVSQRKVLVRDISLGISDRKVGAAMKKFGEIKNVQIKSTMVRKDAVRIYPIISIQKTIEQKKTWKAKLNSKMDCAYIGFDSEASCNSAIIKPLVIGNILVHWVPTGAKECHFCYQVRHLVSKCLTLHKKKERDNKKVTNNIRLAKLYVRKNVLENTIKIFGKKSYAKMAALKLSHNLNNTPIQTDLRNLVYKINQLWRTEINKLKQQVNKMAKLLSAVAAKLKVTIEKKEDIIVTQQLLSQSTTSKSNLAKKKDTYNSERKIKEIKKTLEPIMELLKQMKKQGSWSGPTTEEPKFMETDDM
ncbi:hypothetical protein G9A89_011194 [Geosiphon pyriformis]|nr:hypothetical protein G9A89_011194 [Geosiphon pyriformis]